MMKYFFQEEYLGEDAAKHFLDRLPLYENVVGERKQKFRDVLKTQASPQEWQMYRKAKVCHIAVASLQSNLEFTEKFWIMIT